MLVPSLQLCEIGLRDSQINCHTCTCSTNNFFVTNDIVRHFFTLSVLPNCTYVFLFFAKGKMGQYDKEMERQQIIGSVS